LTEKKPLAHYDFNSDGEVGVADLVKLQRFILGYKDDDFIMVTLYNRNT
jgi:arabinogalactan endo-1,4-beta-galactosidase